MMVKEKFCMSQETYLKVAMAIDMLFLKNNTIVLWFFRYEISVGCYAVKITKET